MRELPRARARAHPLSSSATAGSAFDDDRMGGIARKWRSETKRQYSVTDARGRIVESKTRPSCGVRSEQLSG